MGFFAFPRKDTGQDLIVLAGFFAFPRKDTGQDLIVLAAIAIGLGLHVVMYAGQRASDSAFGIHA